MKKVVTIFVTVVLVFTFSLNVFAAGGYTKLLSFGILYAKGVYFADKYGAFYVLDADKDSSLVYKSLISYDDLAGICADVNSSGVNCSLHQNIESGYWVIAVNDPVVINSVVGLIGNTDGYVYVAEIDTTGEDSVDLLSNILTRLILVESYVKSTFFEIWEQGQVLDDIYLALDDIFYWVTDIADYVSDIASDTGSISDKLQYNGTSVGRFLFLINSNMLDRFGTVISFLDSLDQSAYGIGANLQTVISSLSDLTGDSGTAVEMLESLQSDVSVVSADLELVTSHLSELTGDSGAAVEMLESLQSDVSDVSVNLELVTSYLLELRTDLRSALAYQQEANASLSNIEALLTNNETSVARLLYLVNLNMLDRLDTMIENQGNAYGQLESLNMILANVQALLQEEGAFTTDISGVLTELNDVGTDVTSIKSLLSGWSTSIKSIASSASNISSKLNVLEDYQSDILALMQEDGAFTTDISGVLTDLETMVGNQSDILALMQEDGAFTTDISGVVAKLQELIDLVEDLEIMTNVTVENIENITIDITNEAYEVFYVTDFEGNKKSIGDFSGEVLVFSGRFLNFFNDLFFNDILFSGDEIFGIMSGFYVEDIFELGGSLWE